MEGLPEQVRNQVEGLFDGINPLGLKKEFWATDCGKQSGGCSGEGVLYELQSNNLVPRFRISLLCAT